MQVRLGASTLKDDRSPPRWFWPAFISIVAVASVFRLWNLSADPFPFHLGGVEVDEGYWVHNARLEALGIPLSDDLVHANAAGPLSSLLIRLSFEIGGISFATARIPSALTGIGLILIVAWFAFTAWGWRHTLVAAFLMSFGDIPVTYSRLAVVEGLMTFFLGMALLLMVHPVKRNPLLSGVFAALALLSKITFLYFLPGLIVAIYFLEIGRARWKTLGLFTMGFLPVLAVWLGIDWIPNFKQYAIAIKAAANSFEGYDTLRAKLTSVLFNPFFGQPSTVLLLPTFFAVASYQFHKDKHREPLITFTLCFLVLLTVSRDHSARRFIPLFIPFVLIVTRPLAETKLMWSPLVRAACGIGWGIAGISMWKGRWLESWGDHSVKIAILLLYLGTAIWLPMLLANPVVNKKLRLSSLCILAAVFATPIVLAHTFATRSLYAAATDLAKHINHGALVTGPLAHTLSLEGDFYPLFYAPHYKGLAILNARADLSRVDYQIYAPGIANWGPIGLGVDPKPLHLATYNLFEKPVGNPKWKIELYRLNAHRAVGNSPTLHQYPASTNHALKR